MLSSKHLMVIVNVTARFFSKARTYFNVHIEPITNYFPANSPKTIKILFCYIVIQRINLNLSNRKLQINQLHYGEKICRKYQGPLTK